MVSRETLCAAQTDVIRRFVCSHSQFESTKIAHSVAELECQKNVKKIRTNRKKHSILQPLSASNHSVLYNDYTCSWFVVSRSFTVYIEVLLVLYLFYLNCLCFFPNIYNHKSFTKLSSSYFENLCRACDLNMCVITNTALNCVCELIIRFFQSANQVRWLHSILRMGVLPLFGQVAQNQRLNITQSLLAIQETSTWISLIDWWYNHKFQVQKEVHPV